MAAVFFFFFKLCLRAVLTKWVAFYYKHYRQRRNTGRIIGLESTAELSWEALSTNHLHVSPGLCSPPTWSVYMLTFQFIFLMILDQSFKNVILFIFLPCLKYLIPKPSTWLTQLWVIWFICVSNFVSYHSICLSRVIRLLVI